MQQKCGKAVKILTEFKNFLCVCLLNVRKILVQYMIICDSLLLM